MSLTTILTTPLPLWQALLMSVFAAFVYWFRGVLNEDKIWDTVKKIYNGKLLRIDDLITGEHFTVLGFAPSDEGKDNPRFAIAELSGIKNRGDSVSQPFGVTFAIGKVTDKKGNFLFKAGNIIEVTPERNIKVVS